MGVAITMKKCITIGSPVVEQPCRSGIDTFTYDIYNGNGWLTIPVAPNHLVIDSVAFFTLTFSSAMAAKLSVQGSDMQNFHYYQHTLFYSLSIEHNIDICLAARNLLERVGKSMDFQTFAE